MKIRIGIADPDKRYLQRITNVFNEKYAGELEVYSFSDFSGLLQALGTVRIDVVLASEAPDVDPSALPPRCGFAYLSETQSGRNSEGYEVISKFQRIDLIYKQVLNIFSEKAVSVTGPLREDDGCLTAAFSSPAGGTGTTTMAAAAAMRFAMMGRRTIYLGLDIFGRSDDFFTGEGTYTMSDVIFALKNRNANLGLKLESCVRRDIHTGAYFYASPQLALDMAELTKDDIMTLIEELKASGKYDVLILDAPFGLEQERLDILRRAEAVVMVSDGRVPANAKITRAAQALAMKDRSSQLPEEKLAPKLHVIYNLFSQSMGKQIDSIELKCLGVVPRYGGASVLQILSELSGMPLFDTILG